MKVVDILTWPSILDLVSQDWKEYLSHIVKSSFAHLIKWKRLTTRGRPVHYGSYAHSLEYTIMSVDFRVRFGGHPDRAALCITGEI